MHLRLVHNVRGSVQFWQLSDKGVFDRVLDRVLINQLRVIIAENYELTLY